MWDATTRQSRFLVILLVFQGGCGARPDNDVNRTIANLQVWADVLEYVVQNHLDSPCKYSTTDEVIKTWSRKGHIPVGWVNFLEEDAWGRPFQWNIVKEKDCIGVRVLSRGRNSKHENGDGDDLWVEVVGTTDGQTKVRFSKKD